MGWRVIYTFLTCPKSYGNLAIDISQAELIKFPHLRLHGKKLVVVRNDMEVTQGQKLRQGPHLRYS